jgi:hypothetical protein
MEDNKQFDLATQSWVGVDRSEITSSLDFLRQVYRDVSLPLSTRMRAASIAIQFECPKLGVQVNIDGSDIAARLDRALARSGMKVVNGGPVTPSWRAIEAPKVNGVDEVTLKGLRRRV